MKKVILAFDGGRFSEGAFEFVRRLNKAQPVLVAGLFLPQTSMANLWSYAEGEKGSIPLIEPYEAIQVRNNIAHFEKLCRQNGIDYRVHRDFYDLALPELKRESEFADLLVLGSEKFYNNTGTSTPNIYLRDALHDVKCPVVVVPEKYEFPQSVILAYDGSEGSVYAIKQFAYLFPEMSQLPTILVHAKESFDDNAKLLAEMEELASSHFKNLSVVMLKIDPKKYFQTWIAERKSAILVCGSYGRSGISELFRQSFIQEIISDHRLPVFIAHK